MNALLPNGANPVGTILILEDEGIVSMLIEDIAREMGASDVHVFSDVGAAAMAAGTNHYDCAVLDLLVKGADSISVADILATRGIPFVFSTGVPADQIEARHRDRPVLAKPFANAELKAVLAAACFDPLAVRQGCAAE